MATKKLTRDDLDGLSKDELSELAEKEGLTVTRAEGDGAARKVDYVEALDAHYASQRAATTAASVNAPKKGGKRLDETVPGGRYVNADGATVDANGKKIGRPNRTDEE